MFNVADQNSQGHLLKFQVLGIVCGKDFPLSQADSGFTINDMERYDLIVFESYTYRGEKRTKAHRVGKAVPATKGGGFMLYIPKGISITGRVMLAPEREGTSEIDLVEAYYSAADELGL